MAMSVTYATVHGRLVEENRGGVVTEYVPDTLGSVIMTTDESGTVTSTTTYWPFGEVRSQTGTNPSPWGFCGVWGYLTDAVSRMYVRARHYRADVSRWLTVDPVWPGQEAYGYVNDDPLGLVDPSGLWLIPVACAAACAVTAGCALGIWQACGGSWGQPEFGDCVRDFIGSLPPVSQIGCGVGLLGCLGCLAYYLKGRLPIVPPGTRPPIGPKPPKPELPSGPEPPKPLPPAGPSLPAPQRPCPPLPWWRRMLPSPTWCPTICVALCRVAEGFIENSFGRGSFDFNLCYDGCMNLCTTYLV